MPKKKRRVKVLEAEMEPAEMELEEAPEPEAEAGPVVEEEAAEAPEAPAPVEVCSKCGLPRSEFPAAFARLRPDLQTHHTKCPRCAEPVEPF